MQATRARSRALGLLALAGVSAAVLAVGTRSTPANAASVTVVTGSGTGATDPVWNVTPPAGSATAATIVTTAPVAWTATITGARWISTAAAPTTNPAGTYLFEATVVAPPGATLSGSIASPDAVTISLVQGATTTTLPGTFGGSAATATPVTAAGPFSGSYTMRLSVNHTDAAAPVGVIATFTLSDGVTEPVATQYHALATPVRVYDSRTGTGSAATGDGPLASGSTRTISLAQGYNSPTATTRVPAVPTGATSALVNITIDGTTNTGFLTVYASNVAQPATSSINWFGTGQILANLNVVALATDRTIKVTGGGGGTTQVIVDVLGYYSAPPTAST